MARIRFLKRLGEIFYPATILQAIKDPFTQKSLPEILSEKTSHPEEKALAQALAELNGRIAALEAVIAEKVVDHLEVVNEFNVWGVTNLILTGAGAPAFAPDFVGQKYIDETNRKEYTAFNTANAGGWE